MTSNPGSEKESYVIPQNVRNALRLVKQIIFIPKDEDNRFPKMLIVFDGNRLARDPEERQTQCKKFYQDILDHILMDFPLGVFKCNFTSEHTTEDAKTLEGTERIQRRMPLPYQQSFEVPENYYLKPDYVIRVENSCDDSQEHESFKELAKLWKQAISQMRSAGRG